MSRMRTLIGDFHRGLFVLAPSASYARDWADRMRTETHPKVQGLYESWGYAKAGEQQPFADSPVYAVMVKPLRG